MPIRVLNINRPPQLQDVPNTTVQKGAVVEIVLHEEVPVVSKDVVAAERVRLGTQTVTESTTVSGELRREEIELPRPAAMKNIVLVHTPEYVGPLQRADTLTAILGRMAMDTRREVTWEQMMKEG